MKSINYVFAFICLFSFYCFAETTVTPSEAYLQAVPFNTIIDLYEHHPDAEKNPQLKEFAAFFKNHQSLFDSVMEKEKAYTQDAFIFYRGTNGQRLVFDTIRALYERSHKGRVPDDFVFFRDPEDPTVRTDDLWDTIAGHWPPLYPNEKQIVLQKILNRPIPTNRLDLLWNVLWGDLEFERDLTPTEQRQVTEFVGDHLAISRRYMSALSDSDWPNWLKDETQVKRVKTLYAELDAEHHGDLIGVMQALKYAYDYSPAIGKRLSSVNLSLFSGCVLYNRNEGLYPSKDECTPLYWFASHLGFHKHVASRDQRREYLVQVLKLHGIPIEQIDQLERLYSTLKPVDDQLLFQIIIPKRMVREEPLIDTLFYLSHSIGRPAYYLDHERPSHLLEIYNKNPADIPGFLQLQGRLLFTKEGLLNPHSGIKIFVYYLPGASQKRIQTYLKLLSRWADHPKRPLRRNKCF